MPVTIVLVDNSPKLDIYYEDTGRRDRFGTTKAEAESFVKKHPGSVIVDGSEVTLDSLNCWPRRGAERE